MVAAGCSGGDWELVEDRWTLPRYYAMVKHWKDNGPPVYLAVAAYLGLVKTKKPAKMGETGNLDELVAMFSGSNGVIQ